MQVLFSYSRDLVRNYIPYVSSLEDFSQVLKSSGNYSAFQYRDNYRNESNSIVQNLNMLILDFDNGMTLIEAKKLFVDYTNIIATTKSHQKEKHGIICDRFRVVLPFHTNIIVTKEDYTTMLTILVKRYGNDPACKDLARFFYGTNDSEIFINHGKFLFDFDVLYRQSILYRELIKPIPKPITTQKPTPTYAIELSKPDWLRKIMYTDKFKTYMKFHEFGEGGRNTFLYSASKHLIEEGLMDNEVKEAILWLNSQGDALSEKEIETTIFRSLKI